MSVCMLSMCATYVELCLFKASSNGISQQDSCLASQTESTYKAERERDTFRQQVRGGFGPDSYLETPACFLFSWPVESQSQSQYVSQRNPLERSEADLNRGLCTGPDRVSRHPQTPPPALSSATLGLLNSFSASSWTTPSSSWRPASRKRGLC